MYKEIVENRAQDSAEVWGYHRYIKPVVIGTENSITQFLFGFFRINKMNFLF